MRFSNTAKLGAVIAAAACVGLAGAQTNGPSGLSVRVGLFLPSNSDASNVGKTWLGLGADYKLSMLAFKIPGVDLQSYFGVSADFYTHGGDNDLPVAFTYNLRQGSVVYSAGIGPEFRNSGDLTSTGVGIAEQLGVAFEFGNGPLPLFVQAKYFISSRPELGGLGLFVGARF